MSFADGEAYNAKLMPISRGDVSPDRKHSISPNRKIVTHRKSQGSKPEEFILYDLWESMRAEDRELANEVLEPMFAFMKAQTDKVRVTIQELGRYLEYRENDIGKT